MTKATKIAAWLRQEGALVALAGVCIFGVVRYEAFPTPENLLNVLRQNSMLGLIALGMTFVILTGGIDLSVGSLLAIAGVVAAKYAHHGILVALLAGVGAAALLGFVNGVVIAKARIQPFITTLAMMIAARGLALVATGEESVRVDRLSEGFTWLGRGFLGPLPVPVVILALGFALGWLVLNHTRFGRHVYAVGDNEEAARLMGLEVPSVTIGVYTVSGALAGLAGVLLASRLGAGQPVAGTGWELDAIAAVVVGGTLLTGGQGGAGSTLVGVLLLGVLFNLFNLEGTISPWWQWVLRGLFLLVVVVVQSRLGAKRATAAA
ncbi:ABC transporter permease [Polyangium aurulentum]|uniref:ABC transporter permease n=1 Tax=Polyangium aurulentum TaxID=2567896 RepID=UPI0010ADB46D|nr:ABC transporter permease [Polyangium aurulentum]UQA56156.1 ABC transporter permease [Polyangium aurulentum]